jgi:regulatory protein
MLFRPKAKTCFFRYHFSVPRLHKRKFFDEASLYEYAVGALSRKMRTVAELKRLLRPRVEEELLVDVVIARLKEQKYLNDSQYAATYSAYRQANEKFGRRRVITDLKIKGVHPDVIEKAVDQAYAGISEEKLARQYLERKRLRKPSGDRESARIFRTLLRAGFSSATIFKILKKWHVPDETLDVLEGEQESLPEG